MKTEVCKFNSHGIEAFKELISEEREKVEARRPALVDANFLRRVQQLTKDPELIEAFSIGTMIDTSIVFSDRFELGSYLNTQLPADSSVVQYSNVGLWAWVSAIYMRQLLEPQGSKGMLKLWSSYRYVPVSYSKLRYYRHLSFMAFWVHRSMGETVARFFLSQPAYSHSDTIEQLWTQDRDFLTSEGLMAAAIEMYLDPTTGVLRPKALGKETPGSARRLATQVAKQLQMNFDLHSMSKEEIFVLLPNEFDTWRINVQAS